MKRVSLLYPDDLEGIYYLAKLLLNYTASLLDYVNSLGHYKESKVCVVVCFALLYIWTTCV